VFFIRLGVFFEKVLALVRRAIPFFRILNVIEKEYQKADGGSEVHTIVIGGR